MSEPDCCLGLDVVTAQLVDVKAALAGIAAANVQHVEVHMAIDQRLEDSFRELRVSLENETQRRRDDVRAEEVQRRQDLERLQGILATHNVPVSAVPGFSSWPLGTGSGPRYLTWENVLLALFTFLLITVGRDIVLAAWHWLEAITRHLQTDTVFHWYHGRRFL